MASKKNKVSSSDPSNIDTCLPETVAADVQTKLENITLTSLLAESPPSQEPVEFPLGTLLNGRYQVDARLGQGGMGIVYRITDQLHPERLLALKTIRRETVDVGFLSSFKVEFETMTKLDHPNLAKVYDFEIIQGTDDLFFTMEFIEGQNIYEATQRLDWEKIVDLTVQICRALSYLHSREVIHFDLKPSNVFVTREGVVKLLDFGIAGAKPKSRGTPVGTPTHMAPEIITEPDTVDHRYDFYSLGIMLFQLLFRQIPFSSPTSVLDIFYKQCYEEIDFKDLPTQDKPDWLMALIKRLCAKKASERPQNANLIIDFINQEGHLSYDIETIETLESYVLSTPFVGRTDEFERAKEFINTRTQEKSSRFPPCLFFSGPSGIGKSRLVRELKHYLQLTHRFFLEGNCYEDSYSEFSPIVEVLTYMVRLASSVGATELIETYAPYISQMEPNLIPEGHSIETLQLWDNPEAERIALIERVNEFILKFDCISPVILYFNDLQWARQGTIDFLSYLSQRISQTEETGKQISLVILGSFRDEEIKGTPSEKLIDSLKSRGELELLKLSSFEESSVNDMICSMLGVSSFSSDFIGKMTSKTSGNPFFIEEAMRFLVETEKISFKKGLWDAKTSLTDLLIPDVTEAFIERLKLLEEYDRSLLEILSLRSIPSSFEWLFQISGIDETRLSLALNKLLRRQILKQIKGDEISYGLKHDRMRETIVQRMPEKRREALHLSIAQGLEDLYAEKIDFYLNELAYHYYHSPDKNKAFEYCTKACLYAKQNYSNETAVEMAKRALELFPTDSDNTVKLQLFEVISDCHALLGNFEDSLVEYKRLFLLFEDKFDRARIRRKMGEVNFQMGHLEESIENLSKSIELLGYSRLIQGPLYTLATIKSLFIHLFHRWFPSFIAALKKDRHIAREILELYSKLHYVYYFYDTRSMILPLLLSVNLAERIRETEDLCHVYAELAPIYSTLGFSKSAVAYANKALRISNKVNRPWFQGIAKSRRSLIHEYMAEWNEAIMLSDDIKNIFLNCGDIFELSISYATKTFCLFYKGDLVEAKDTVLEGLQLLERSNEMQLGKIFFFLYGWIQGYLGNFELAFSQVNRGLRLSKETNDASSICLSLFCLSDLHYLTGETDQALSCLLDSWRVRKENKIVQDYVMGIDSKLAALYLEKLFSNPTDEKERSRYSTLAKKAIRKALKVSKKHPNFAIDALISLGVYLRLCRKDQKASDDAFSRATERAKELGARLSLGSISLQKARCKLVEDTVDKDEVDALTRESISIFEECNARALVSVSNKLLQ